MEEFQARMNQLEEDHKAQINTLNDRIAQLVEDHKEELDELRAEHDKETKEFHKKIIEKLDHQNEQIIDKVVSKTNKIKVQINKTQDMVKAVKESQRSDKKRIKESTDSDEELEEEKLVQDHNEPKKVEVHIKVDDSGSIVGDYKQYESLNKIDTLVIYGRRGVFNDLKSHCQGNDYVEGLNKLLLKNDSIQVLKRLAKKSNNIWIWDVVIQQDLLHEFLIASGKIERLDMRRVNIIDMGLFDKKINAKIDIKYISFYEMCINEIKLMKPILRRLNSGKIDIDSCYNINKADIVYDLFYGLNIRVTG